MKVKFDGEVLTELFEQLKISCRYCHSGNIEIDISVGGIPGDVRYTSILIECHNCKAETFCGDEYRSIERKPSNVQDETCKCGHAENLHEVKSAGTRTWQECNGDDGNCPCEGFEEMETK